MCTILKTYILNFIKFFKACLEDIQNMNKYRALFFPKLIYKINATQLKCQLKLLGNLKNNSTVCLKKIRMPINKNQLKNTVHHITSH